MTLDEALEIIVKRTGVERFRVLCVPPWPDHEAYATHVLEMAARPAWLALPRVAATFAEDTPSAEGCGCGGRA